MSKEITKYVLGFMFDLEMRNVVLIRKQRPDWQKGYLNGVGGHIEPGENPAQAMAREFKEETGVFASSWSSFGELHGNGWIVYLFWGTTSIIRTVRTMTDEEVEICGTRHGDDRQPNLRWLIPMAMACEQGNDACQYFIMHENSPAPCRCRELRTALQTMMNECPVCCGRGLVHADPCPLCGKFRSLLAQAGEKAEGGGE